MKKVYLMAASLLLAGSSAWSQSALEAPERKMGKALTPSKDSRVVENNASAQDRATVYWQEDFNGATGLTTGQGTWTAGGPQSAYWDIGSTHPLTAFGWTNAMDQDFLIHDSYNPNDSETDFATTPVNSEIISPAIDLSAFPAQAVLTMDVETMYCCNFQEQPYYLYISTDGGTSWSSAIPLNFGVDRNEPTEDIAHPLEHSVNITPYLDPNPANNNDVHLRFSWEATNADANGQINTHYWWSIDDVRITEVPPSEIQFLESAHANATPDPVFGINMSYSMVPDEQIDDQRFYGTFVNTGSTSETNFQMLVEATDASMTSVYSGTSPATTFNTTATANDTLTDSVNVDFTPGTTIEEYTFAYTFTYDNIANDDNPNNNVGDTTLFQVTDNEYARDNGIYTGAGEDIGADGSGNAYPYILGTPYEANANQQLDIIRIALTNDTEPGAIISGYVSQMDPAATSIADVFVNVVYDGSQVANGEITVTTDMISDNGVITWVNIPVVGGLQLTAGNEYLIGVQTLGGEVCQVMETINPVQSLSYIYDVSNSQGQAQATWFGADQIKIRGVFDVPGQGVGIDENDAALQLEQNIPNPFNGMSEIRYNLNKTAEVTFEVVDVTGKQVMNVQKGTQAAGEYNLFLNADEFAPGVYYYTLRAGEQQLTKKMIITE